MELKELGSRIKDLRKKKHLTQEELSEASNMNGKHLSELERGLVNITIQNLDKIAGALDVSLLSILDIAHEKSKEELSKEIVLLLEDSNYEQVQCIYRIINSVVR